MTAPHFHTTREAKDAIERIEHNSGEGSQGPPTGIMSGSARNQTTMTPSVVQGGEKGEDWVHNRGIKEAGR